jgi:hypothetical protein
VRQPRGDLTPVSSPPNNLFHTFSGLAKNINLLTRFLSLSYKNTKKIENAYLFIKYKKLPEAGSFGPGFY